ncbi:GNAT family N-acetyltransferase [Vibrio sinaloensis]|uniref:GNAT family N-acetyltransferase n=1 Tax=Photobacterium sp. (strain ATCC 43367) TaxID=379097 RepID=UPI0020519E10|nr:GNAT family N-acetyltransferase [Vibrio sinaloensis]UPQ86942.1 GNAT family N-acetyltransferase [Vibrio sinaloensis]
MTILIEPIQAQHNSEICKIIKSVGKEFGAIGEGFGPSDAEVEAMSDHYTLDKNSLYLVASIDGKIVGGCGLAPFQGSESICELKKLFLLPESRGFGLGKQLTERCLTFAESQGFSQCYLDTLKTMTSAIKLYESLGFNHLDKPLDGTEHGGCDVWMLKTL